MEFESTFALECLAQFPQKRCFLAFGIALDEFCDFPYGIGHLISPRPCLFKKRLYKASIQDSDEKRLLAHRR
jgi:hypothetical protein